MLYMIFVLGTYHKYDSMAYPKIETKNVITRAVGYLKFWSSKSEVVLPNHEAMQSDALLIYLQDHTKYLLKCSITNIEDVSKEIAQIFIQLRNCLIWIDGHGSSYLWKCEGLNKV